jgi:predicted metal-dependent peptidase
MSDLPLDLTIEAGGGTKFIPVFEYIKKHKIEMEALLFFTDMEPWEPWENIKAHNPGIPVLWMNTNRSMDNFKPPFGTMVPLKIDPHDEYRDRY